jgi:hypothetical protein
MVSNFILPIDHNLIQYVAVIIRRKCAHVSQCTLADANSLDFWEKYSGKIHITASGARIF